MPYHEADSYNHRKQARGKREMNFIGLDIGSTSIKGVVWDIEKMQAVGEMIRVSSPGPVEGLPPGHFELDPLAVAAQVADILDQLMATAGRCDGIVSCTQMAGVVLADERGVPLTNYLSWRDQRLLETYPGSQVSYYDVLRKRLGEKTLVQLGRECKLGSSPGLLFWLKEKGELPPGSVPLMLGDFVGMHLAGAEPVTEYTNALGAMNLETRRWHDQAFRTLGIDHLCWPRLCDPFTPVGRLPLGDAQAPWYPSVGDHQCALAGTLLAENELSINASTGSQVSILRADYSPGDYQVRPYFDQQYLNTLTHLPAGRSLNVLVDLLTELARSQDLVLEDPWHYILSEVQKTDTDLGVELTFFPGPMGERGQIHNISLENFSVGPLFRAAFENMADNYKAAANRLTSGQVEKLVLSGGLVQRSEALQEMIGRRFPCPRRLFPGEEETMVGLLVLALVASGQHKSLSAASRSPHIRNLHMA